MDNITDLAEARIAQTLTQQLSPVSKGRATQLDCTNVSFVQRQFSASPGALENMTVRLSFVNRTSIIAASMDKDEQFNNATVAATLVSISQGSKIRKVGLLP